MDDPEAQLRLQPYLLSGERILWTGQPDPRRLVGGKDAYLIPFSLMWGGGAVFWEAAVLLSGAPIFFVLWGIPFVLVGQYLIWGRLLAKRWDKKRTVYAVTSQRVLVVRGTNRREPTDLAPSSSDPAFLSVIGCGPTRGWTSSGAWVAPGWRSTTFVT